jgi:hypothetical protein
MLSLRPCAHAPALWLALTALLLTACAVPDTSPPTPTAIVSGPDAISVGVASNDFGVGSPRIPFVMFQGAHPITDATSVMVTAFDLSSGTAVPAWSGPATGFADYDLPYWVVYPQMNVAGRWGMVAALTRSDGSQAEAQFVVTISDTVSAPDIGAVPPASQNRTLASEPDLAKLTSDVSPEPGLYQLTVAEALASGQPTVVTFATPAFCTSRLCAPVVDSVKAVFADLQDSVNFIHIEVYKDFGPPLVYADEMDEWHLPSEPWTYVLDREGKVVARLGGPVSPAELRSVLEPLVQ